MATFFTRAVETINELKVCARRLGEFLALPEPPVPCQTVPGSEQADVHASDAAPEVCFLLANNERFLNEVTEFQSHIIFNIIVGHLKVVSWQQGTSVTDLAGSGF